VELHRNGNVIAPLLAEICNDNRQAKLIDRHEMPEFE